MKSSGNVKNRFERYPGQIGMSVGSYYKKHPSLIGITIALIILATIAVYVALYQRPP